MSKREHEETTPGEEKKVERVHTTIANWTSPLAKQFERIDARLLIHIRDAVTVAVHPIRGPTTPIMLRVGCEEPAYDRLFAWWPSTASVGDDLIRTLLLLNETDIDEHIRLIESVIRVVGGLPVHYERGDEKRVLKYCGTTDLGQLKKVYDAVHFFGVGKDGGEYSNTEAHTGGHTLASVALIDLQTHLYYVDCDASC
jgi:hypothetical protein